MRFIAIGDNCIDYYVSDGKKYPGGNAVNFAVYIKKLGGDSAYLGVVGDDENGKLISKALKDKGVDVRGLRIQEGNTAITDIALVNGERKFTNYDQGVYQDFKMFPREIDLVNSFPYIHTAIGGKCENYLLRFKNSIISYDFSTKYDQDYIRNVCTDIDYAFISYNEDDLNVRNLLKSMVSWGAKVAVATLGEKGSLAYDGSTYYTLGIVEAEVIDTLGAGDSFIAGFMYSIASGESIDDALRRGTKLASETIQYFGAW